MNVLQLIKRKQVKENILRDAQMALTKRNVCYIVKK